MLEHCFYIAVVYVISWLIHGRLIKRINNTIHMIRKNNYGLIEAWLFSGKAI